MKWNEKIDLTLNQGVDVTRKIIEKARESVNKVGDQSVVIYETRELEKEKQKLISELGNTVYNLFLEKGRSSISSKTVEIKPLVSRLEELKTILEERKDEHKDG